MIHYEIEKNCLDKEDSIISKRNAAFLEKAPADIISDVVDMVFSFIEI